jgi:hypothetical protein
MRGGGEFDDARVRLFRNSNGHGVIALAPRIGSPSGSSAS